MTFALLPSELQHVAPEVLQDYLRSAISRLAAAPALASRLRVRPADLRDAVAATFDELCASESRDGSSSQLKLVFRHDCQNLTCLNPRCALCCQNPNKRCPDSVNFASKYLEKNPLKSKCGASIKIEVVNAATGELAHSQLLQGVQLELSMLDGKKFAALHETGEDMASCELFLTPKGKELLNPGRLGTLTTDKRVRMSLTPRGQAVLSTDLSVQVSSEAMLGGQKSPYKLLVRAVNQHTGLQVPYITFVASEDFVVATPRVAKAVKAEIPCVDDPVSKLEDIGEKTQKKLLDIQVAAESAGVHDLVFPDRSITTVGQFKQLVELSNTDPRFNEKLKQFLIPNKAREHVALAVENDKRLRMWYSEPNNVEGGLLYRSVRARVDLEHPDVLVQHKVLPSGTTEPDLTPCSQAQGEKRDMLRRLIHKAKEDWKATDHPNWSIRDMDSAAFLDSHMQPGQTVYAPIPDNRHLDHGLGLGSGSSFGSQHQGSGQLPISPSQGSGQLPIGFTQGSGHLPFSPSQSGQFGVSPRQSGQLSTSNSQGSGQLLGQLLGQNRSGSLTGAASWQGAGQIGGSPRLTGAGQIGGDSLTGQARSESPFALGQYTQPFQCNEGPPQLDSGGHQPSSNGFGGFPLPSSNSPFFHTQQTSMADIFPSHSASLLQPATSQAASTSMSHWPSATGTASGTLPHQFSDQGRLLQDLQRSLSSQGSPSISPAPFGSHVTTTSGANGNSPALTQNSAPSSTPNGHPFHPGSGSGSLAGQLARPAELDRVSSGYLEPGPKRMRAPQQQQQQPEASSAFANPSSEIARQQQMLKQRHSGSSSPSMVPSSPFGRSPHQESDPGQLHMAPPTSGGQPVQAKQQQQQESAQPQQRQLGNPDLQKNIIDHLHGKHVLIMLILVAAHAQTLGNTSPLRIQHTRSRAATSFYACIRESTAPGKMLLLCCVRQETHMGCYVKSP
ncbi:TPA: PSII 6.1 kDa protein, variant 2 [Trebouxia sp. C0004]